MATTRRAVLAGTAAAALAAAPLIRTIRASAATVTPPDGIRGLFADLPGDVAGKIVAPAAQGRPGLAVEFNASKRLFVGSAFKTFVLCEALRQADSPAVTEAISSRQLALNETVWSPDSASFNPPYLAGQVSERTTLEAMITHSDNTATDMALQLVGPDSVRAFIAATGLRSTMMPDSTRIFLGYLLGAKNYKTFTWADLVAAANDPIVNSPLNDVETMASSADDLVAYYSHSLRGAYFTHPATLSQFREILAMGGAIWLVPLPLGVSAFAKGGSIDVPGFHAVCVPGGMFFDNRWVYFCLIINWYAPAATDPATVTAFLATASLALTLVKDALSSNGGQ
jgi:beta-lactamase class A